ncbi:MAG TPA: YcaO-like family protein, partial [Longimicrobiales bacterium]|nr:YcaO-like family protein [Longimicrobiales bacterium]
LCERVERHAVQLAAERPEERLPVDPASIETPYCRELVERIRAAGMKLAIYDVTWEARLPCVYARLASPELPHAWMGAGCHTSRDVALSRALTEAAQSRLTYIAGARDDIFAFEYHRPPSWIFDGFVEPAGGRPFSELPDCATDEVAADLDLVLERLDAAGLEAYWVDLTRPEIGIPVGVAFVPGLGEAHRA